MSTNRPRGHGLLLSIFVAAAATACGAGAGPPGAAANAAQAGSAGSAAAAGSSLGANAGSAGSEPTSGGSDSASAAGSGGAATAGVGGVAGLGGAAGNAGTAAAGAATGGSAVSDDMAAAAVLNDYHLLDPCQSSYKAVATPGDVCPQDTAVKNQHLSLEFGGDSALTYNVTLHVRGIMEGYWYTGGTLDPVSKTFYTGGVPTVGGYSSACKNKTSSLPFALPTEVSPTDGCWNGFNMFALTVSEPAAHYYLNYTANKSGDRPPHAVYSTDYSVTIPIKGQAKLEFFIVGSDEHECYNFNKVLSGVTLPASPYIGEFVQFDVTAVTRAP